MSSSCSETPQHKQTSLNNSVCASKHEKSYSFGKHHMLIFLSLSLSFLKRTPSGSLKVLAQRSPYLSRSVIQPKEILLATNSHTDCKTKQRENEAKHPREALLLPLALSLQEAAAAAGVVSITLPDSTIIIKNTDV